MANEEHVAILKRGVAKWNQWRRENSHIVPDLSEVNLNDAVLSGANLSETDLRKAYLRRTNLRRAYLSKANLSGADLYGVDLGGANLSLADFDGANFRRAKLGAADFIEAKLSGADWTSALCNSTSFGNVDLSRVKGLKTVKHQGPSYIDIQTIYRSSGNIPEEFLRGAGVPDNFIIFMKSLTGQAFEFYSCFISYSSQDEAFAQRLYNDLQGKGVRCWFAPKDMKIGDEIRRSIDQAIRLHDKVLLVLSEHSIDSRWVQKEVETAFEQEAQHDKPMLFPIRLDDTVMATNQPWAADIRRMKHIGDFTRWKQHDAYQQAFEQLLRALKAEK